MENMKRTFLILALIFSVFALSFAQESTENQKSNIKTPEELQREVLENKNPQGEEDFEEFEYPEESEPIKSIIKVDVFSPIFGFAVSALTGFNTEDGFSEIIRTPLYWEFFLDKKLGIALSVESLNAIYFPKAVGVLGGITYYPFAKAPSGLFIKALAGGTLGMIYSFTAQTGAGYQIVTKDKFVMSFGADFAFYPAKSNFFWIPSISAAFGWAF